MSVIGPTEADGRPRADTSAVNRGLSDNGRAGHGGGEGQSQRPHERHCSGDARVYISYSTGCLSRQRVHCPRSITETRSHHRDGQDKSQHDTVVSASCRDPSHSRAQPAVRSNSRPRRGTAVSYRGPSSQRRDIIRTGHAPDRYNGRAQAAYDSARTGESYALTGEIQGDTPPLYTEGTLLCCSPVLPPVNR